MALPQDGGILSEEAFLYCLDRGQKKRDLLIYLGKNRIVAIDGMDYGVGNAWVFELLNIESAFSTGLTYQGIKRMFDNSNYEIETTSPKDFEYDRFPKYVYASSEFEVRLLFTWLSSPEDIREFSSGNVRSSLRINRLTGEVSDYATPYILSCQPVSQADFRSRYERYKEYAMEIYNKKAGERRF